MSGFMEPVSICNIIIHIYSQYVTEGKMKFTLCLYIVKQFLFFQFL
jgi:hypothetical protein